MKKYVKMMPLNLVPYKKIMPNSQTAIKYVILAILAYLFYLIIKPFLPGIVLALVFAIGFYWLFNFFHKKIGLNKTLSTIIVFFATIILIFTPIVLFLGLVVREALSFASTFNFEEAYSILEGQQSLNVFGYTIELSQIQVYITGFVQNFGQNIFTVVQELLNNIFRISFLLFVFFFVYFFLLFDGENLLKNAKKIMPFSSKETDVLFKKFRHVSKTVFVGNLVGAILSGLAAFIGFKIFGVPGALIWGILAGLLSLIPTIGTLVVYGSGAIIVFIISGILPALLIIVYFLAVEIFLIQSIVKPKLIDEKISVHPIFVFFAIVGGIGVFGSMGLIYGPLIVVLFFTLFEFIIGTKKA